MLIWEWRRRGSSGSGGVPRVHMARPGDVCSCGIRRGSLGGLGGRGRLPSICADESSRVGLRLHGDAGVTRGAAAGGASRMDSPPAPSTAYWSSMRGREGADEGGVDIMTLFFANRGLKPHVRVWRGRLVGLCQAIAKLT